MIRYLFDSIIVQALVVIVAISAAGVPAPAFATQQPADANRTLLQDRGAVTATTPDCQQIITLLKKQNRQAARDMAQLKRELIMLRAAVEKPGLTQIFGGIGYIFGFTGIAFFVYCRSSQKRKEDQRSQG